MNLLKSFFGRRNKASSNVIKLDEIAFHARTAIQLLGQSQRTLEDDEVCALWEQNDIPPHISKLLLIFLPITFVRCLLPQIPWSDYYKERFENGYLMRKRYYETPGYLEILAVAKAYFKDSPNRDIIINIAGRSAEFHVINELLLMGEELSNCEFSETIIIW